MDNKRTPSAEVMDVTLEKIREMIDVNTIVGETITAPDGTIVIPVSRLSFGFGAGGTDHGEQSKNFAGGGGAGVNIKPVAFLVITPKEVKLISVDLKAGQKSPVEQVIDAIPGLVDKVKEFIDSRKADGDNA